jgi:hypothetical protein
MFAGFEIVLKLEILVEYTGPTAVHSRKSPYDPLHEPVLRKCMQQGIRKTHDGVIVLQ